MGCDFLEFIDVSRDCFNQVGQLVSMYFPRPFLTRPNAPISTGTVSVSRPHILEISISRSLYFHSFLTILTDAFRLLLSILLLLLWLLLLLLS